MKLNRFKKKVMAVILLPLFFLFISYGTVYIIAAPYIQTITGIVSLATSEGDKDFNKEVEDIFKDSALTTQSVVNYKDIVIPNQGSIFGKVEIQRVGLNVPLYYGDDYTSLYYGAGFYRGSSMPGFGHPTMIAGHTIPYFLPLGEVVPGDIVRISTHYGIFEYEIDSTRIAYKRDATAYNLKQDIDQLILYTCYPLDGIGVKEDRLFVYAHLVSGPRIEGLQ